ncbi:MAG: terminase small subunit [Rhodocyclales bacterium]|nr:terminase small subunit [Rhodocyclales bacterium]
MTGTALTVKQARFCDEYVVCGNAAAAARAAGYRERSARQIGSENLSKPYIQTALQARQQALAARLEITHQDVISAVLGAIKAAQEQGNPAVMLRGWVEIARMLDFYNPETLKTEQEQRNGGEHLRYVSTAELRRRVSREGQFRNPDGSTMTPAQLDAFYEGLTDEEVAALAEGRAVVETRVVMFDASDCDTNLTAPHQIQSPPDT